MQNYRFSPQWSWHLHSSGLIRVKMSTSLWCQPVILHIFLTCNQFCIALWSSFSPPPLPPPPLPLPPHLAIQSNANCDWFVTKPTHSKYWLRRAKTSAFRIMSNVSINHQQEKPSHYTVYCISYLQIYFVQSWNCR